MDGNRDIELSIIMPCLNEAETLAACINKAKRFLQEHNVSGEIVIGDNGSTDGSQGIAEGLGARVVNVKEKGYGNALMGAIAGAKGKYIIMGDSDDSYDFSGLMPFVEKLREGYDLVMGNRFKGKILPGAMPPLHRYLGNPVLSFIGKLFFSNPSGDFHCGLRGFSKEAAIKMDLRTTGMGFASEIVVKAALLNMKITEVPTTLSPDGRSRPPHLRSWRDGWRHLRFLLLYSPRWLFLYPGIIITVIGVSLGAWVLPHPRFIGNTMIDVHSLLYAAAMILIGFQAISFAVFSRIYGTISGLLPKNPGFERIYNSINLETGLMAGGAMMALGAGITFYAVTSWAKHSFGSLNYQITFRQIIPAVLLLALGCQILFSSFFLSMLGLKRK